MQAFGFPSGAISVFVVPPHGDESDEGIKSVAARRDLQ
jgi:hypothetical protein